eukprot:2092725-Prymnesium_polylepis.1
MSVRKQRSEPHRPFNLTTSPDRTAGDIRSAPRPARSTRVRKRRAPGRRRRETFNTTLLPRPPTCESCNSGKH